MIVNFDDIRSFNDKEYAEVIKRLLKEPVFVKAVNFFFPNLSFNDFEKELLSYNTINDFQSKFFCRLIPKVEEYSMEKLYIEGLENINDTPRLFISNHRDIVLDSALINYGLNSYNLNTSEIAIGSNLLETPWVKDLVRLNKSFIVKRNIPKQEMLQASIQLSNYIQYVINEKKQSVWIAQREGRAKDGNDITNPGLLKMFCLSSQMNLIEFFTNMNITPVSISYEYDPCDIFKIPELLTKHKGGEYIKKEGEDNFHMVTGIKGNKGNVKVIFSNPINDKIKSFSNITNRNELLKHIAFVIDNEIHEHYHLWPTNYIAYDILYNTTENSLKYSDEEKNNFINYYEGRLASIKLKDNNDAKDLFLAMYANPVKNKLKVLS